MGGQRANPEPLDFSPQPEMARVKYLKERKHRATSGYITDPSKQIWKTFSTLDNLPILQLAEATQRNECKSGCDQTQPDRAAGIGRTQHRAFISTAFGAGI